jgi:hypothetical protein
MVLRKTQQVAGQDEACGAPGRREQRLDGRRRWRDRLLDERAKVALKRLKSDLDMGGGRRSDDNRVCLDLLDEAQGIGEALRERRARARRSSAAASMSAIPLTITSGRPASLARCSAPKAPVPATSTCRGVAAVATDWL